jgi:enoyl-CoA hydratase/carnithine racemase
MLNCIEHGEVVELRLARPPVNAMNQAMLDALLDSHASAVDGGARAVVLSGVPGMFSGGLDVPELLTLDREAMARFWETFFRLMHMVAASRVPVLAAITGHSPAGGAVLAIHCDYRVATRGEFRIGLNEVQVGLPVPRNIIYALVGIVGTRQAERLTTAGKLISPEEALAIGLVDALAEDPDAAVELCLAEASALLDLPPVAMNATRLAAKADFLDRLGTSDDARIATDYWFSDETQLKMKELVASLKK